MNMDNLEAIFSRRSIRKYTGEPVTEQELETVLRAGFHAPTAHNLKPVDFIVIKDKNTFEHIASFHPYAKMLLEAEVCIVVCGNQAKQEMTGFLIQDCSAAIENILIAANGIGLGAVWCGLYPVEELTSQMKEACSIPDDIIPVGMIVLGRKGEEKKVFDRYDPTKIHNDKW
jgi:nitroreductase